MVQPSFVSRAYELKTTPQQKQIASRQTNLRYAILILAVLSVFGCEYCFDNPSALQSKIERNYERAEGEELSEPTFNLLYALYAFPNVIIPLFGGYLIDRIGARSVLVLTALICLLGQGVLMWGGFRNMFSLMLVGRLLFGFGGEVLHAAENTVVSQWFSSKQLSMALGICISFPKLGSSLNNIVSPEVSIRYETDQESNSNVGAPMFVGLCFMAFSLVCALVLFFIELRHERLLRPGEPKLTEEESEVAAKQPLIYVSVKQVQASTYGKKSVSPSQLKSHVGGQHVNFKQIFELPAAYWLLITVSMLAESLFIPFLDNGNQYYQVVFKGVNDNNDAGVYLIIPYCISFLCSILIGFYIDRFEKRSNLIIGSSVFFVMTYGFMMYLETDVALRTDSIFRWFPCVLLGICIACFCSIIVASIPMLVTPQLMGTSFGLMEMIQNLALGVFPLLAGVIRQTQQVKLGGFHLQTLNFFLLACLCLAASILLKAIDSQRGCKLNVKDFQKKYHESAAIEAERTNQSNA